MAMGMSSVTRHRLADEFAARRQALALACPPGSLIVVPGHPDRYQQQNIPYENSEIFTDVGNCTLTRRSPRGRYICPKPIDSGSVSKRTCCT